MIHHEHHPTGSDTMAVAIAGPNLRDQSRGDFHVHAAGCADLVRGARREPEYADAWTMDAATREDVADAIYPPEDFGCEPGAYVDTLAFFPCCAALPSREVTS